MIELDIIQESSSRSRRPESGCVKLPIGKMVAEVRELVDQYKLHTICRAGIAQHGNANRCRYRDFYDF